jgi:hypothetical protein
MCATTTANDELRALQYPEVETGNFEGVSSKGTRCKEKLTSLGLNSSSIRELVHTMGYTLAGDIENYLGKSGIESMKILPFRMQKLVAILSRPKGVDLLLGSLRKSLKNNYDLSLDIRAIQIYAEKMLWSNDFAAAAIPLLFKALEKIK